LIEGGFTITDSWPINTEAEGSMHIREKSAARSTIFLVCRVREADSATTEPRYWEEVEPTVRQAVRVKVKEFQDDGDADAGTSCRVVGSDGSARVAL
jgi:adenine-specific DNA methylase